MGSQYPLTHQRPGPHSVPSIGGPEVKQTIYGKNVNKLLENIINTMMNLSWFCIHLDFFGDYTINECRDHLTKKKMKPIFFFWKILMCILIDFNFLT